MTRTLAEKFYSQWKFTIDWINSNLDSLTDSELQTELAPYKNHGIWILGHLIVSEDDLSLYLGKGEMLFPEYQEIFGQKSMLKSFDKYPSAKTLRKQWKQVCEKNDAIYKNLKDEEFDEPHCMIKGNIDEDFFKTKGNCISIWISHQNYHNGQLAILLSKLGKSKF